MRPRSIVPRLGPLLALVALIGTTASLADESAAITTVPISIIRNKTVVPVRFAGARELHLILDTGMGSDGLLLFEPALRDSLGTQRFMEAQIAGAGGGPPSRAVFTDSASFRVGQAAFENQRVIILMNDSMASPEIDGVIGYSLLGHYAVEIDVDMMMLTLRDADTFEPGPGWESLPLEMGANNLPFLDLSVAIADEPPVALRAYIDCASSEAVELLLRPSMKFSVPATANDVVLGQGLSGEIRGRRGRIAYLKIGPYGLHDLAAAFAPAEIRSKAGNADAVLANAVLRRFNLVYDYAHRRLAMRPNKHFTDAFE